ncbi:hypothetical protein ANANG_G00141790 [Anguilla anguilla]|uniref:Uncharacterized protein n=1 Tax=Anguilla anguilla TaxID=7936 RepID=A0A9D3MAX2_ANGAN|nr:hypothetical protein ANANG_G00141790 [Anguilla anguilla]
MYVFRNTSRLFGSEGLGVGEFSGLERLSGLPGNGGGVSPGCDAPRSAENDDPGDGENRKKAPAPGEDGNTANARPDTADDAERASELGFSKRCTKPKGPRDPPTKWT